MTTDRPGFKDGKLVDWRAFADGVQEETRARTARERSEAAAAGAQWADVLDGFEPIEPGAPRPHVMAHEHRAVLLYHPSSRDDIRWVIFDRIQYVSLGYPNEEALTGHPLFGSGLQHFRAHEVFNSELIQTLEKQNRVHSHHRPEMFTSSEHLLLAFHDRTFDCVCKSWSTGIANVALTDALPLALQALSQGIFPEATIESSSRGN